MSTAVVLGGEAEHPSTRGRSASPFTHTIFLRELGRSGNAGPKLGREIGNAGARLGGRASTVDPGRPVDASCARRPVGGLALQGLADAGSQGAEGGRRRATLGRGLREAYLHGCRLTALLSQTSSRRSLRVDASAASPPLSLWPARRFARRKGPRRVSSSSRGPSLLNQKARPSAREGEDLRRSRE